MRGALRFTLGERSSRTSSRRGAPAPRSRLHENIRTCEGAENCETLRCTFIVGNCREESDVATGQFPPRWLRRKRHVLWPDPGGDFDPYDGVDPLEYVAAALLVAGGAIWPGPPRSAPRCGTGWPPGPNVSDRKMALRSKRQRRSGETQFFGSARSLATNGREKKWDPIPDHGGLNMGNEVSYGKLGGIARVLGLAIRFSAGLVIRFVIGIFLMGRAMNFNARESFQPAQQQGE